MAAEIVAKLLVCWYGIDGERVYTRGAPWRSKVCNEPNIAVRESSRACSGFVFTSFAVSKQSRQLTRLNIFKHLARRRLFFFRQAASTCAECSLLGNDFAASAIGSPERERKFSSGTMA